MQARLRQQSFGFKGQILFGSPFIFQSSLECAEGLSSTEVNSAPFVLQPAPFIPEPHPTTRAAFI